MFDEDDLSPDSLLIQCLLTPEGERTAFVWKGEYFSEPEAEIDAFVSNVIC